MNANNQLSVCVFCGSRTGLKPHFKDLAQSVGRKIAEMGCRLVYGGGSIGLMGAVSKSVQENGGKILGIMPQGLLKKEIGKFDLDSLIVTEDMHQRKKLMFTNSDFAIVLPGGIGTMDEFFEILTWSQLGIHNRPIILVDHEKFWEPLISLLQHQVAMGFAESTVFELFQVIDQADFSLDFLLGSNFHNSKE